MRKNGVVIGLSGAVTVAALDGVLSRTDITSATKRAAIRLSAAGVLAYGASRAGASDSIVDGIVAGPVLVTAFDLALSTIGKKRVDPPPAHLGQPWAPQSRITGRTVVGLLAAGLAVKVAFDRAPKDRSLIESWWK